jgi:hypothetical protein
MRPYPASSEVSSSADSWKLKTASPCRILEPTGRGVQSGDAAFRMLRRFHAYIRAC